MNQVEYNMIKSVKTYILTDEDGHQHKQNIKDIYYYNKNKHLALVFTTKREYFILENVIYLSGLGYAKIAKHCSKDLSAAKEEYLNYSSNYKKSFPAR